MDPDFPPPNLGLYLQKALAVFFSLLQFGFFCLPSIPSMFVHAISIDDTLPLPEHDEKQ
jgi:hypothetical protein